MEVTPGNGIAMLLTLSWPRHWHHELQAACMQQKPIHVPVPPQHLSGVTKLLHIVLPKLLVNKATQKKY